MPIPVPAGHRSSLHCGADSGLRRGNLSACSRVNQASLRPQSGKVHSRHRPGLPEAGWFLSVGNLGPGLARRVEVQVIGVFGKDGHMAAQQARKSSAVVGSQDSRKLQAAYSLGAARAERGSQALGQDFRNQEKLIGKGLYMRDEGPGGSGWGFSALSL